MSKSAKSLARFFREVVAMLAGLSAQRFVLDGELIIPVGDMLSFAALQARLHPAESRIAKLSVDTPARLMAFDCLQSGEAPLPGETLDIRRAALETLHAAERADALLLSPRTTDPRVATGWLARGGGALRSGDGQPLPPRHPPAALATRQGPRAVRHGTAAS